MNLCCSILFENEFFSGVWGEAKKSLPLSQAVLEVADLDRDGLLSKAELLDVHKELPEPKHAKDEAGRAFLALWHECQGNLQMLLEQLGSRMWHVDDDDDDDDAATEQQSDDPGEFWVDVCM